MDTINREDNRSYGNTTRFHRSRCFTILSLEIEKVLIYMNFFFVGEREREREYVFPLNELGGSRREVSIS